MIALVWLAKSVVAHQAYLWTLCSRCLCTGEKGLGRSGKLLHFKGSAFHRVIPGFMCQVGKLQVMVFYRDNLFQRCLTVDLDFGNRVVTLREEMGREEKASTAKNSQTKISS